MKADSALVEAIRALEGALDELGVPAMIIGGVAVIAHGISRTTIDLDATVWGEEVLPVQILQVFKKHGIEARIENAESFAAKSQVLLLIHRPSGTRVDLSLAWLPFEKEALARAVEVSIDSASFRAATPEDLVVYKAVAWRQRDLDDIENLLLLHRDSIDIERVRGLVKEFALILDDPKRVEQFEEIIRRIEWIEDP
ncbi:MAG: nucleotidyltransferase [Acidobacteria bacterium]|nr:nucleotidyltransferase [Acidobacteriota bacterium]